MKFDKETIAGISICILLLIGWQLYVWKKYPKPKPPTENIQQLPTQDQQNEESESPTAKPEIKQESSDAEPEIAATGNGQLTAPAQERAPTPPLLPELPLQSLENELCRFDIDPNTGAISALTLKQELRADKSGPIILQQNISPHGGLAVFGKTPWQTLHAEVKNNNDTITLKRDFERISASKTERFRITQHWQLKTDYLLDYSVEIEPLDAEEINFPELFISAGGMRPISMVSEDQVFREYHSIDYCLAANDLVKRKMPDKPGFLSMFTGGGQKPLTGFEEVQENPVRWVGVSNKYFTSLLIPENEFSGGNTLNATPLEPFQFGKRKEYPFILSSAGILRKQQASVEEKLTISLRYYSGPKEIRRVKELAPQSIQVMHLTWSWFEWISQKLLLLLLWLKGICGSYGLSIILLTVIVKAAFWPLTHRANASMKKMQQIQPLVQELRAKYKSDPQKMNAEVMKLYSEHKVNPLGGCFPILLQMPVFFALYGTLTGAIELRHVSFLWIQDLTLPDTVATIPLGFANLPINPLMIVWGGSMLLQQKLTPSTGDPTQRRMMMFMPLVMTVMFYNSFPAGLTLYWTISQGISIAQLMINQRKREDNTTPPTPTAKKQKQVAA